ncbi:hypothetical protein ABEB36_005034 [Hypothenemus hampei]|uniref:Cytokine-like nuclear factor N-PAC n=1 Tax=Hypothenemus hampei TaxID=57062 RepID=A0ABD1EX60_HYPHA
MKPGFKVGDLVWARITNQTVSAWPARIEPQPEKPKKGQVYVYFFGAKIEEQYGWVANTGIIKYDEESKAKLEQASSRADFKLAIEQIDIEYKKLQENEIGNAKTPIEPEVEPELPKRGRQSSKRHSIESGETSVSTTKTKTSKRKATSDLKENGTKQYKVAIVSDNITNDGRSTPNSDSQSTENNELSTMDSSSMPDDDPTAHTIGFLGLGIMSTGMVNNLIKRGHKINLWSRDNQKCYNLKEEADKIEPQRVNVCVAPCDVMKDSDIVFNCSSDPESAKKNVFENCGVIYDDEPLNGKGFVEMTGIDPETSSKICKGIEEKGGRYLEAQLQGSRDEAAEGTLVVLTAGDNSLFMDCQSCFKAIGKASFYLGEVGIASKVYLILQLMQGISLVGLAEGLVLADRCGISGQDILNIFNMTNMASPFLTNKAQKIINKDFKEVELSIKNMQKDIRLALGLSNDLMQPLMLASAANEVFKQSRKLGYDDHDCSCIYMKARY